MFIFDNRRLLNHEEEEHRAVTAGLQPPPRRNEVADEAIAHQKRELVASLEDTVDPVQRASIILQRIYKLGKLAGMAAELK